MDQNFVDDEGLFRAVRPYSPKSLYWKDDGTISSAALKDSHGLSVDRDGGREMDDVISSMKLRFSGVIARFTVGNCRDVGALVQYRPSVSNEFHCEVHGSDTKLELSNSQAHKLAGKLQIVSK